MAAALADGAVTAEHADVLASAVKDLDAALVDELFVRDRVLADAARVESPDVFRRRVRDLVISLQARAGVDRDARQRAATRLSRRIGLDGMHHITAVLHPELGAAVFTAIDAELASLARVDGEDRDRQQLAAQALGNLISGGHQTRRPHVPEIVAIVDAAALVDHLHEPAVCELHDGTPVMPASVRRWVCQGRVVPIVTDSHGNPFDMGREIRVANRTQRRALRAMYRCCAWDGCDTRFEHCEIHHILPWDLGGPTDLINLLPLCARHHHMAHEGGWSLQLDPTDRTLQIFRPDGVLHATCGIQIHATKRSTPPRHHPQHHRDRGRPHHPLAC
jgi:hypothetical protein